MHLPAAVSVAETSADRHSCDHSQSCLRRAFSPSLCGSFRLHFQTTLWLFAGGNLDSDSDFGTWRSRSTQFKVPCHITCAERNGTVGTVGTEDTPWTCRSGSA